MINKILLSYLLALNSHIFAQSINLGDQNNQNFQLINSKVVYNQPLNYRQLEYVPNRLLIKFKYEVNFKLIKSQGTFSLGIPSIDSIFLKYKIKNVEKLFQEDHQNITSEFLAPINDFEFEIEKSNLNNIYKIEIKNPDFNLQEIINELNNDSNIIFAEPDYYVYASSLIPNDPYFLNGQQNYLSEIQASEAWDLTTGDTSTVIAILDTGVDWLHPDLVNNIWRNWGEIPNNGIDDDLNGKIDDIRGWDFVNNDNNPTDDNSHGTHVAGISAAEGNNGIGISGISWRSKIMPLKVLMANGQGNISDLVSAINYAASKNVTVINMSLGTYAKSLTLESALINSYIKGILPVAAAGNDAMDIEFGMKLSTKKLEFPVFPAAFSFVLGVQAVNGDKLCSFSNYDLTGPFKSLFSIIYEYWNYEMKAPGMNIFSTIRNGMYRNLSGTSMAAPMVSGAICLIKSLFPDETIWKTWLRLIDSSPTLNIYKALTYLEPPSKPEILFAKILDPNGDRDSLADAGEEIIIPVRIINYGGTANKVWAKIEFDELEDTSSLRIIKDSVLVGSITQMGQRDGLDTFKLIISNNVSHWQKINMKIKVFDSTDYKSVYTFTIITERGANLSGIVDTTLILTPNRYWTINSSFRVDGPNARLIILPGTQMYLYGQNLESQNGAKIIAKGTPDSIIRITRNSGGLTTYAKIDTLSWAILSGFGRLNGNVIENCDLNIPVIIASKVNNSNLSFSGGELGSVNQSNIYYSYNSYYLYPTLTGVFNHCLLKVIVGDGDRSLSLTGNHNHLMFKRSYVPSYAKPYIRMDGRNNNYIECINTFVPYTFTYNNNFISGTNLLISGGGTHIYNPGLYMGTNRTDLIPNMIYDFYDDPTYAILHLEPVATHPTDSAHGFVWKIHVDGKNPLDEILPALGAGKHIFEVYFNRPMDTTKTVALTFGPIEPFLQHLVPLEGSFWTSDKKKWTAYKEFDYRIGNGIHQIRVSNALDNEGIQIPTEQLRFKINIDVIGSASQYFTATPGIGKVNLEWPHINQIDLLGYNIYRSLKLNSNSWSNAIKINNELIVDSLFTDYGAIPDSTYRYHYTIITTGFYESQKSVDVIAKPLKAARGDANGDLSVNVLDIVSIVAYILGQNPQPFIFTAADINNDGVINVLDIVGTIKIILGGGSSAIAEKTTVGNARIELNGNLLQLTTDRPVAGIQFKLEGNAANGLQFHPSEVFQNFEFANSSINDTTMVLLSYNLNGSTIPVGTHTLGRFTGITTNIKLTDAVLADPNGNNILTRVYDNGEPLIPEKYYMHQNFPNPFNAQTRIQFGVPELVKDLKIVIYNILGQRIKTFRFDELKPRRYYVDWNGKNDFGSTIASGVYIYQLQTEKFVQAKKMLLLK